MLNHAKRGLERIYDGYEFEDEKRAWFLAWEEEIARLACENGVAESAERRWSVAPPDEMDGCDGIADGWPSGRQVLNPDLRPTD